jgi:hypothetical protein
MTSTSSKPLATHRKTIKEKVRPLEPQPLAFPNLVYKRRDKWGRLSFQLTREQCAELVAQAEAMMPSATTLPALWDDFVGSHILRGRPSKASGIVVDDDESSEPVLLDERGEEHTMAPGEAYRVRGAMKAGNIGKPPTPCVFFQIAALDLVMPLMTPVPKAVKPPPAKQLAIKANLKRAQKPVEELKSEDESEGEDEMSQ